MADPLARIAAALERLKPAPPPKPDFAAAEAFVWQGAARAFDAVTEINRVPLSLLLGIDGARETLLGNTERFARGLPANNALLWGARGMGKSSLVKAVHDAVAAALPPDATALKLVEIHREEIATLPHCLAELKAARHRFLLFCDDLSFEPDDTSYKSLKAVLEGGLEGRPRNVVFYATSNRRHLMPRDMVDNERSTAISPSEGVEERVSLSDRFGLWLGFHHCSQDTYLAMVKTYADHHDLAVDADRRNAEALAWAATRGARSGRVAWQFTQDLAGRLGRSLD